MVAVSLKKKKEKKRKKQNKKEKEPTYRALLAERRDARTQSDEGHKTK